MANKQKIKGAEALLLSLIEEGPIRYSAIRVDR